MRAQLNSFFVGIWLPIFDLVETPQSFSRHLHFVLHHDGKCQMATVNPEKSKWVYKLNQKWIIHRAYNWFQVEKVSIASELEDAKIQNS